MLQPRPYRHSTRHDKAILISDRGQFISETRLLLSPNDVANLLMATTVDDAIRLIQRESCYCALVDNALAGGTDIDAVTRLRRELGWPELTIPVILITERTSMEAIRNATLAGVDEVLLAPMTSELLAGRMLGTRPRARPFVSSAEYGGPCRRRRSGEALVANELRRANDMAPVQMRRLARDVHSHLVTYQATQRAIQLLNPFMPGCSLADLSDATADLYEASFPLQDARISGLALLCKTLAASQDSLRNDQTLLLATLRALLAVLESRLQRAASRIQLHSRKADLHRETAGSLAPDHSA